MTIIPAENGATAADSIGAVASDTTSGSTWPLAAEDSFDFVIGLEATPAQAMERADALLRMALPLFLERRKGSLAAFEPAAAVLTELVDVTARYAAGDALVGRVAFDGFHVTISVGDMHCELPRPEIEPGLYTVHRLAAEFGQYAGDHGGRITWAAVAV
ncbi:hypothetical protein ABTY59_31895 [Streptomyces sp. NPDC096079]|uniref:hypothetical protein n=1 Tax=Streptomyces sp. NPDC096079 TaxID=3155820 RepID=UPI00331D9D8A